MNQANPYVVIKCAISTDGFLDDRSSSPLQLSNKADFAALDYERSLADAILVGGQTIRRDNPKLLVRDAELIQQRLDAGKPAQPIKVALTKSGDLPVKSAFFTTGESDKIVFCPPEIINTKKEHYKNIHAFTRPQDVLTCLHETCGVKRLLVQGGGQIISEFLAANLVDEIQLSIAPVILGQQGYAKWAHGNLLPTQSWHLQQTTQLDGIISLTYVPRHAA